MNQPNSVITGNKAGSFKELLPLAFPIFLSQAIDVSMIFVDRFFLAQLGKEPLAATFTGGLLTFLLITFITGTFGQITPLVAQYKGANQRENCVKMVHQGLFIALFYIPIVISIALLVAPYLFKFFGHQTILLENETRYFQVMSLTVVTSSLRMVLANFFIGLGKTLFVTMASLGAVLLNVPLAYGLIFGKWGLPRLEIQGAAWATFLAGFLPVVILFVAFVSKKLRQEYKTTMRPALNKVLLKKLLRYGLPSGAEMFVNVAGFSFFTMIMYSYSADIAAATTIVLNWDMICFVPMLGLSQAAGSLVGKYLGAGDKSAALRSAYTSLKLGWIYGAIITVTYFTFSESLVNIFTISGSHTNYDNMKHFAVIMLKISCLYFFIDVTYSILGGILKGSGDTLWTMVVSNSFMWICALTVYLTKERINLSPIGAWIILTSTIMTLGVLYMIRFLRKRWLNRLMIKTDALFADKSI